jgi:RNA 3'-terminal phosphate cyclase (GTP)
MTNIRTGRDQPGLKAQHLVGIQGLVELCGASAKHTGLGSLSVTFSPAPLQKNTISLSMGTAGSITLLLQSLMLPIVFSKKKVTIEITGGTDVAWSPPLDYLSEVFLPCLAPYAKIMIEEKQRGCYPKGGGRLVLSIEGKYDFFTGTNAPPITYTASGALREIRGRAFATKNLEQGQVCERMQRSAEQQLTTLNVPVRIEPEYCTSISDGAGITLWTLYAAQGRFGASCLGKRGVRAEDVGKCAVAELIADIRSGTVVDKHLADQLISYLGAITMMTGKECSIGAASITDHLHSNILVVEKFLEVHTSIMNNKIVVTRRS